MTSVEACYALLNVHQAATPAEIKEAYRRLARRYHPDLNPGNRMAEERFKQVNAAYEMICEYHNRFATVPQPYEYRGMPKRVEYDRDDTFNSFVDALLGKR